MIPDNLIDVDFTPDGLLDSEETFGSDFPDKWLVPRSSWRDMIREIAEYRITLSNFLEPLNNQNPESSCVSNATESCIRVIRNVSLGVQHSIKLSPMSLYCRVSSRRHSGSTMQDNLHESNERGLLPEDNPSNRAMFHTVCHQNTPFFPSRELPDNWETTARHFRSHEWYQINSRQAFGSALLHRWPICYGRNGHSIAGMDLVFERGRYYCRYLDSYGTDHGENGYLYDSERQWSTHGAWCLRSVTLPHRPGKPAGDDGR